MDEFKDKGWSWLICVGSFVCNLVIGGQINCSGVFMSIFVDNYKVKRAEAGRSDNKLKFNFTNNSVPVE